MPWLTLLPHYWQSVLLTSVNGSPHVVDEQAELETFTAQLRAARRRLRVSQEVFGPALGVSALAIGSWETGKDTPGLCNFVRWCEALGYAVDVTGFSSDTVLVPRADELFDAFHIRRLMRALAEAREAKGLTQPQVGAALGVSGWSIHMWERAFRVPRLLRLIAWCPVVGCRLTIRAR
ncbi:MAG TPA: helix-turn-helix transcriptional regulator [Actinocrinis sp.]|uniref:helix-turn-helix transcriptional regulator n=1 Tax=Actinocrinis sp. TaxID=1920516 RepID=UPI002DDDA25A|nr:helix-turn-helix transcriptional regulator [Actinocrinis sp.]HEV3170822.1 helix-turn-helix transcriptional regulator [Actinocrinis sp.]